MYKIVVLVLLFTFPTSAFAQRAADLGFRPEQSPSNASEREVPPALPLIPRVHDDSARTAGLVLTPLGGAIFVAGVGVLVAFLLSSLPTGDCFPPDKPSQCHAAEPHPNLMIAGGVLVGTGGLTAAVGGILLATSRRRTAGPTGDVRLVFSPTGVRGTF